MVWRPDLGDATVRALRQAVEELERTAPKDHDVLVVAFNLTVREVAYFKPHTLSLRGIDDQGNDAFVVCHFSQLVARVVCLPTLSPKRIITGFANVEDV